VSSEALDLSKIQLGDPSVIAALENALNLAKAGQISSVGIVMAAGPQGVSINLAGPHMLPLTAGAAHMHRMLLDAVFQPQPKPGSGLLVPKMGR
jgi:hypothetical protein